MPIRVIEPAPEQTTAGGRIRVVEPARPPRRGGEDMARGFAGGLAQSANDLLRHTTLVPGQQIAAKALQAAGAGGVPGSVQDFAALAVGANYRPETRAGRYSRATGAMLPNAAMGPGGAIPRVASVVLPAVASEGARELAEASGAGDAGQAAAQFGGALAGGLAAAPRVMPRSPPRKASPQRVLREAGVRLTPGQQIGGLAKSVEDLGMRAPIVGPAIRGARQRVLEDLNRAAANRPLAEIGETVPKTVPTGNESVAYVAQRAGKLFDEAAELVPPTVPDEQFAAGFRALDEAANELPPDQATQFRNIVNQRVASRLNGPADGRTLMQIREELAKKAADYGSSADAAQRDLGALLGDAADEIVGLMGRTSPEAAERLATANAVWANYVRLNRAAAASNTGIFTPGQLSTAVRASDRSVRKSSVGRGEALMQDLAQAAAKVIPDQFGNPGTADAALFGGLGVGVFTAPQVAIPTAGALTAAALPYFAHARGVVTRLPKNATRQQLIAADQELARLAQMDPSINELRMELAKRIAVTGLATAPRGSGEPSSRREPPRR